MRVSCAPVRVGWTIWAEDNLSDGSLVLFGALLTWKKEILYFHAKKAERQGRDVERCLDLSTTMDFEVSSDEFTLPCFTTHCDWGWRHHQANGMISYDLDKSKLFLHEVLDQIMVV